MFGGWIGEEHPDTLDHMNNLALTYQNLGRYNEALDLQEPLLEVSKQVMGEGHPNTLTHTNNLALTYRYLGRYNEALDLQKPLFEVSKQVMGEEHPDTLTFGSNLILIYKDLGMYNEHEKSLQPKDPILHDNIQAQNSFPSSNSLAPHSHPVFLNNSLMTQAQEAVKQKVWPRTRQGLRVHPKATSSRSQVQPGSNNAAHLDTDKKAKFK